MSAALYLYPAPLRLMVKIVLDDISLLGWADYYNI
jgi:hypothetical protein